MEESHPDLGALVGKLEIKEESKVEVKSKKDIAKELQMIEENASDDSGEGVDSDDLDDEIQDNVEQIVMQQQMFAPIKQENRS